ncbi:hypothetical protein BC941DRAFT_464560 [Chlamydoabsidia padenii]|nr:hypothetical protein BC941DRAFT_464560 [Chlamydoabsidia padenii]
MLVWGDFGDITAVNIYLAHGTPTNYTILQVAGDNIPNSIDDMVCHLPSDLPNSNVFFMLEGNDSPKTIVTRSVYVESAFTFPNVTLPSGFPSISLPSNFPISLPTIQSNPTQTHADTNDGPPIPMIVGIIVGAVSFFALILVTVILMKRRTIRRNQLALRLVQQQNKKQAPQNMPQKSMDINSNVAVKPMKDEQQQQQQHTEYNINYQQQQANYNQHYTSPPMSPGGFVMPSSPPPKFTHSDTASPYGPAPNYYTNYSTHDNGQHATTSPLMTTSSIYTPSTVVYPPDPTYQKFTGILSTKTATTPIIENKPDDRTLDHQKPDTPSSTHKPHSKSTYQKPHLNP